MSEKKKKFVPTESQRNAIEAPVMDLLVSAAAGSGKTAVLSKRIIRMVTDPTVHADISRMLIVTFTKAAASELRSRIGKEMREALQEVQGLPYRERNGESYDTEGRLLDALDKLESAEISTIHSFCMSLLKKYSDTLSISASFRIGDEAECKLMQLHAMNETVENRYENDEEFNYVAETLIKLQDSELVDLLYGIYKKMIEQPDGIAFLLKSAADLRKGSEEFWHNAFAEPIKRRLNLFFDYYRQVYQELFIRLADDAKWGKEYADAYGNDLAFILGWDQVKDSDYVTVRNYIRAYAATDLGRYTGPKSEDVLYGASQRTAFIKGISAFAEKYFVFHEAEVSRDCLETAAYVEKLHEVLCEFETRYESEKKRYGILDYGDLERYAYALLIQDGEPTPLARTIAAKYDAIFIDEYQDTNERQDAIFASISTYNRFMVGDIKQSIYGFRGAMPEIFSHYREIFPTYQKGAGQKQATIFLSNNFRSNKSVVDYANAVFQKLFCNNSGRVPYRNEDALEYSVLAEYECHLPTRVLAVNKKALKENGDCLNEYEVMAREIANLVRSGVSPKDIAVLFRSMTNADQLRSELDKLSVKTVSTGGGDDFFLHAEALLLVALLNVIDNPNRDIYLAAVLKSPLFGLTLGEMVVFRDRYRDTTLYAAVTAFASLEEEALSESERLIREKLSAFLAFLERARRFSELKSAEKVVRYLYSVTPIRAVAIGASGNGSCLSVLYELARNYESRGFKGLHSFVKYLAELESDDKNHPSVSRGVDLSAVQLMSIHKSKGLEFDYVFLAECEKKVTGKEAKDQIVCDKTIGVGLKLRERDGFVRYDTLIRHAVMARVNENDIDEEMRVLYVALTRAKKQLILVSGVRQTKDKTAQDRVKEIAILGGIQHPYIYAKNATYGHWVMMATPHPVEVVESLPTLSEGGVRGGTGQKEEGAVAEETLLARLSYVYPHKDLAQLPTKLSVSRLYPGILDEESEELLRSEKADFDRLPAFMQPYTRVTPAEKGTATHLFMQFCDFDRVIKDGVEREIERLVEDGFITDTIASLIYRDKLKHFFESELFARICASERVYREERFNVRLKASEFTDDPAKKEAFAEEYILVQGVVDCLIKEKDGSLILVDYKTDRLPTDREEAEAILRQRYTTQLTYYKYAVEKIYHTPVKSTLLYSFFLNDTVTIE